MRIKIFWQPAIQDCLFLVVLVVLSLSSYVLALGFYDDDWAILASMSLSSDQSFSGIFRTIASSYDNAIRPVQFFAFVASYKLFGFNPLGYHLLNGIFLSIGFVLLYFIVIALHQPRVLAISITVLYMLLPNYSTDRFWIVISAANISMCLCFLGIYAHLQAMRRWKHEAWRWETLAILCVIGSGFSYEVFLPLVLLMTAFLFVSELATDWPHSANGRTIGKAALRHGPIVVAVALVMLVKALWAPRVHRVEIVDYLVWISHYTLKAFVYSYGYHIFEIPSTFWHALREYANSTMVVTASLIGIVIFARMYTVLDRSIAAAAVSRAKMSMYLGCGIALFIAGYSLFPLNPAKNGINNRAAIAGTLGVAVSVVGILGMLTSFIPSIWRKALFSAAVAFIGMSGALTIGVLGNFWIASYRIQNELLSDIHDHIPVMPSGTTLILDGVCPYNGPAPIFEAPWDLSSALAIRYGHAGIEANIVTRWLTVRDNGLTVPSGIGPITYPFGQLYMYHFGRKARYALPDAPAAQSYLDRISTDRASRCPPDVYGNGVDVLDGFIPVLGRRATAAGVAPPR